METATTQLEKISQLIVDLKKEITAFPRYERELNHNLLLKNKESTDIVHIIENIELAPYEAIKVTERLHEVRKERRKIKQHLTAITPLQQELSALLPILNQKLDVCKRQETYHQRDTAYQFRTVEGYQLLKDIVEQHEGRSNVPLTSPDHFVPMNPKFNPPVKETVEKTIEPVLSPVVEPISEPLLEPVNEPAPTTDGEPEGDTVMESAVKRIFIPLRPKKSYNQPDIAFDINDPCKIVLNNHQWFIHSGSNVLCKEKDLRLVVDKVFELGLEHVGTNDQSRHVLIWNLKELKRKNPSRGYVERCNQLIKMIQQ